MVSPSQSNLLRRAFSDGKLRIQSVSPQGEQAWKRVLAVHRAEVGPERILLVTTEKGSSVMTAGHRVFLTPTEKTEALDLTPGTSSNGVTVTNVSELPERQYMYDLTAEDWHNFILVKSGLLVSNSPDRNYHFRPPAHEETIGQFNRVFGHIWEDEELNEFIKFSLDAIVAAPPRTPFNTPGDLVRWRPEWRTLLLTGAANYALLALMTNWISDEFSYSIGGVSLDIEKSSKYESAANNFKELFESQLERAKATVKVIRGLQQPRYGVGIRSAFGPYSSRGALTPRQFVGF